MSVEIIPQDKIRTECCLSLRTEPHYSFCSANADLAKVEASFAQDEERWVDSYVNHNTENVRRRVVAASNGIRLTHI